MINDHKRRRECFVHNRPSWTKNSPPKFFNGCKTSPTSTSRSPYKRYPWSLNVGGQMPWRWLVSRRDISKPARDKTTSVDRQSPSLRFALFTVQRTTWLPVLYPDTIYFASSLQPALNGACRSLLPGYFCVQAPISAYVSQRQSTDASLPVSRKLPHVPQLKL